MRISSSIRVLAGGALAVFAPPSFAVDAAAAQVVPVKLVYNLPGIWNIGTSDSGGLDGGGSAYVGSLIGTSLEFDAQTFVLAPPGNVVTDRQAVTSTSIALPAGQATSLSFLGGATHGNGPQPDQKFIVTYTDSTSQTFTQSMSNFGAGPPQGYAGETTVLTMPDKILNGVLHAGSYKVYGYTFALDSSKTVKSLTMPDNPDVFILAVNVSETQPASVPVTLQYNLPGIWQVGSQDSGGLDGGGSAYDGALIGSSLQYNGQIFELAQPGFVSTDRQAVTRATIGLPSGRYASLSFLGGATRGNGPQPDQQFIVTYTDSTQTFTQSMSNFGAGPPQGYAG